MQNNTNKIFKLFIDKIYACLETGNHYEAETYMVEAEEFLTQEEVQYIKEAVYADYRMHL